MASIEITCANPDCDSEDITLKESIETRNGVFEHSFECNICHTRFFIATELITVKIPEKSNLETR
jgi:hypothetical protein